MKTATSHNGTVNAAGREPAVVAPAAVSAARRHRSAFGVAAVLPFGIFLLLFAVYPLAELVRMAFSSSRFEQGRFAWSFNGLANFGRMFGDSVAWDSVVNTVLFIGATVPLTLALGTTLALLVDRGVVLAGLTRAVVLWPAVITPVVVSVIWLLILSPTVGVLNKVLSTVGMPEQTWLASGAGAMFSIILVDVWHWTPVVFLLVYTAMRAIDPGILEAARVDGATELRAVWYVVLPLLRPAIAAAALIRLVMGVKAFDEMFLLTHGGPGTATTLVSLHIRSVFFDRLEFGYGAAFSLAVVAGTALIVGLAMRLRKRHHHETRG